MKIIDITNKNTPYIEAVKDDQITKIQIKINKAALPKKSPNVYYLGFSILKVEGDLNVFKDDCSLSLVCFSLDKLYRWDSIKLIDSFAGCIVSTEVFEGKEYDRRKNKRYKIDENIDVIEIKSNAKAFDISETGLGIRLTDAVQSPKEGEKLTIFFSKVGFLLDCKVARVRKMKDNSYEAGLTFNKNGETERFMKKVIKENY